VLILPTGTAVPEDDAARVSNLIRFVVDNACAINKRLEKSAQVSR
jgi:hypothetical protein